MKGERVDSKATLNLLHQKLHRFDWKLESADKTKAVFVGSIGTWPRAVYLAVENDPTCQGYPATVSTLGALITFPLATALSPNEATDWVAEAISGMAHPCA